MQALLDWLDDRTGYRHLVSESLDENIPGGSRWRYVWGSTLVFTFFVQVVTGIALWMFYSPSTHTAWESVYYLQEHVSGGWLLRGVHHYTAQAMVILLVIHMLQVVISGAYRAPREINFWVGLILMQIVLGLALTGYLLPWDQKGYWATKVATEIAGSLGEGIPALAVGGADYGHLTLTRFFALHAGVLPSLLVVFLVIHIAAFRRHGITAHVSKTKPRADERFWPEQILKDAVACLAVLLVVVGMAWAFRAELGAPADAAENYSAARPEWYFLFLFQFLKYFPGEHGKLLGAIVIPGLVMGFLFLMPILGRRQAGHRVNIAFLLLLLGGAFGLTLVALDEDYYAKRTSEKDFASVNQVFQDIAIDLRKEGTKSRYSGKTPQEQIAIVAESDPERHALLAAELIRYRKYHKSRDFLDAVQQAARDAHRVRELAVGRDPESGAMVPRIPPLGALSLLRTDAKTQGPKLFRRYCASCHDYAGDGIDSIVAIRPIQRDPKTGDILPNGAPNLYRFASRAWLSGLLDPKEIAKVHYDEATAQVLDAPYFGNTRHHAGDDSMVAFVKDDLADLDEEGRISLEQIVVALSAQAQLGYQTKADAAAREDGTIEAGTEQFSESFDSYACSDCHRMGDIDDGGEAPDLTGYGSRQWLIDFISDPAHARFYGEEGNDRMPQFNPPGHPEAQQLTPEKIEMIADWLREAWYEPIPTGGENGQEK